MKITLKSLPTGLWLAIGLLLAFLLLRWGLGLSLDYAVANYFHRQISPSPNTRVSYDIKSYKINWTDLQLTLHDIKANIEQGNRQEGITTYRLHLPAFSIDLLASSQLIFQHRLDIEALKLDHLRLDIVSPEPREATALHREVGDLHQKTLHFLQEMNFRHFEMNHAKISWQTEGMPEPRYRLNDLSLRMDDLDIRMDSLNAEGMANYLLASHFDIHLQNDTFLLPDGSHQLHFRSLQISNDHGIRIDSLRLTQPMHSELPSVSGQTDRLQLPYLSLSGLDFLALYQENKLLVDSIEVGKTDLYFCLDEQNMSLFEQQNDEPAHALEEISIGHMRLTPSRIHLKQASRTFHNTIEVDNAALLLDEVVHRADDTKKFAWTTKNLELHLENYQTRLEELNYAIGFDQLNWSFENESFGLKNLEISMLQDSLSGLAVGSPQFIRVPLFQVEHVDFEELLVHRRLTGGSILVEQPELAFILPSPNKQAPSAQLDLSSVLAHFFTELNLNELSLNEADLQLYGYNPDMQVRLFDVGTSAYDWQWKAGENLATPSLEAFIQRGSLRRDDVQLSFEEVAYTSTRDQLNLQAAILELDGGQTGLQGTLELQDLSAEGLMALGKTRTLTNLKLEKLKARLRLPEEKTSSKPRSRLALGIGHLQLNQVDAEIFRGQTDTIHIQNARADLKQIQFDPETEAPLPFSWNMDQSGLQVGASSVSLATVNASLDSLHLSGNKLSLMQLHASSKASERSWQLSLPELSLEGIQISGNEQDVFRIGKAVLHYPRAKAALRETPTRKAAQGKPSVPRGWSVMLDTLLVDDAQWEVRQGRGSASQSFASNSTTLTVTDLAYPFKTDDLFNKNISLHLQDIEHRSEELYFNIASVDVSLPRQQLDIRDADFSLGKTLTDADIQIKGSLPSLMLRTQLSAGWRPSQDWIVSDVLLQNPQLNIDYQKLDNNLATRASKVEEQAQHPAVRVSNFAIESLNLKSTAGPSALNLQDMHFSYQNFSWEKDQPLTPDAILQNPDWQLGLGHVYAAFGTPRQEANVYGLHLDGRQSSLTWDSSRVAPLYSPYAYSQQIDFQKSWIAVNTGEGAVTGLDMTKLAKGSIHAPWVKIQNPNLRVFRDKRLPFPENHYPPMLHKALAEAQIPVSIDTVELSDAQIKVNIQPPKGERLASIRFTNTEVYLTNVTNLPEEIKANHLLNVQAYAKIQDAGLLKAQLDFDLVHPGYPFFIEAELGRMDLRKLNTLTEPIASVRIKKGRMRRMNFQALANEDFAYGNMDFMYRGLNIQMLSKKDHEHHGVGLAVESFLANRLILRKNNDYPFPHRQGKLFVERDETRSIFNYLAKISLNGILSSAGIKSNRKALYQQYQHRKEQFVERQEEMFMNSTTLSQ